MSHEKVLVTGALRRAALADGVRLTIQHFMSLLAEGSVAVPASP